MAEDGLKKVSGINNVTRAEFATIKKAKNLDGKECYIFNEDDGSLTMLSAEQFSIFAEFYGDPFKTKADPVKLEHKDDKPAKVETKTEETKADAKAETKSKVDTEKAQAKQTDKPAEKQEVKPAETPKAEEKTEVKVEVKPDEQADATKTDATVDAKDEDQIPEYGNEALIYYQAPIKNLEDKLTDDKAEEFAKLIKDVADLKIQAAQTEEIPEDATEEQKAQIEAKNDEAYLDAAKDMSLSDIEDIIKAYKEEAQVAEDADDSDGKAKNDDIVAKHQALLDFLNEHETLKDDLRDGGLKYETTAIKVGAGGPWNAIKKGTKATAEFLGVTEMKKALEEGDRRTELHYKHNGVTAGLTSAVGQTAAQATAVSSRALERVADPLAQVTDAVDNMDEGVAKNAAQVLSGPTKLVNSALNLTGGILDGLSYAFRGGEYTNDTINEATKATANVLLENMKDTSSENILDKKHIIDLTKRLGKTKEELSEMDSDQVFALIKQGEDEKRIPAELIISIANEAAAKHLIDKNGNISVTDWAEAKQKFDNSGKQFVEGLEDTVGGVVKTVGALGGYGWLWGAGSEDKTEEADGAPENADAKEATEAKATEVKKTTSASEIKASKRKNTKDAWLADFTPKFEANKAKLMEKLVPTPLINEMANIILEERNPELLNKDDNDADKTAALGEIKQELYSEYEAALKTKLSEFEAKRIAMRAENKSEFQDENGNDTFWTSFWNEIDDAQEQDANGGDRGFGKNATSVLVGFLEAPAKMLTKNFTKSVDEIAAGVPLWQYRVAFSILLGSEEHIEGLKNIIGGKYNSAQKEAGYKQQGYALFKDIVVYWSKHESQKAIRPKSEPQSQPQPVPEKTPCEKLNENPGSIVVDDDPVPVDIGDEILDPTNLIVAD